MRHYKKLLALATALTLLLGVAACGGQTTTSAPKATTTAAQTTAAESKAVETTSAPAASSAAATTAAPAAGGLKTGLGIVTKVNESKAAAADAEGAAVGDSSIAAVLVDASGKIVDIKIDGIRAQVKFDGSGKVTTDKASEFKSKNELGAAYGMNWMDQAKALADYCKGKTLEEIKATKLSAEGVPQGVDALASVSIHIGDALAAIELAVNNAKEQGAQAGDKLGLGSLVTLKIKNVGDDEKKPDAGQIQVYNYYTALSVNAGGKVTSAINDAAIGVVAFDKAGAITNDITAAVSSKNILGDAYGMKKNSKIGKEWNEQAAALAKYFLGKTAAELKATKLDDTGHLTEADILASVSVHVNELLATADKAFANAQ